MAIRLPNREKTPAFVAFGVELPWIFPLVAELGAYGRAHGIHLSASYRPFRRTAWPFDDPKGRLRTETWSYPPGFNGTFAGLFNQPIRSRLNKIVRRLRRETGQDPYVITPYPSFGRYVDDIDPARLVYINYDDYSAGRTELPEENAIVARADTILCSSEYQTTLFKQRFQAKEQHIFHLPHGVHELFLNPEPWRRPDPRTVCSIGYLTSRSDWRLVHAVATKLTNVTFRFVGDVAGGGNAGETTDWTRWLDEVLRLPNVQHVAGLKHRQTAAYYWKSAVNWMPYEPDLPFVRACCPLKLTDGLASGRPVISAEVPECRLYPEWVRIYSDADEAVSVIEAELAAVDQDLAGLRAKKQIEFARRNTWATRADRLLAILNDVDAQPAQSALRA